jgi:hypothetical protein
VLLGVLVLELLLALLMLLFGAGDDVGILFWEDAGNLHRNIVVDYNRVILACDVDAKFFGYEVSIE